MWQPLFYFILFYENKVKKQKSATDVFIYQPSGFEIKQSRCDVNYRLSFNLRGFYQKYGINRLGVT